MKSRITIEVDFDNGNTPVIQILQQNSSDVRDSLIQSFLQSLAHTSRWCKILYIGHSPSYDKDVQEMEHIHRWRIVPITPKEIPGEIKLMEATIIEKAHEVQ